jgi:hypothetical protein
VPQVQGAGVDPYKLNKVRYIAIDKDAKYLFATAYQSHSVFIWQIGNPDSKINWAVEANKDPSGSFMQDSFQVTREQYLPYTSFKLTGGYNEQLLYNPEPKQIAIDSINQNVFVVDSDGALFVYLYSDTLKSKPGEALKPYKIVHGLEGEMRDLKISQPALGKRGMRGKAKPQVRDGA